MHRLLQKESDCSKQIDFPAFISEKHILSTIQRNYILLVSRYAEREYKLTEINTMKYEKLFANPKQTGKTKRTGYIK